MGLPQAYVVSKPVTSAASLPPHKATTGLAKKASSSASSSVTDVGGTSCDTFQVSIAKKESSTSSKPKVSKTKTTKTKDDTPKLAKKASKVVIYSR